jgi:multidrug efflux pump
MLGVTMFGILLTPVFFVAIDRISQARVFRSPTAQLIGNVILGILTLGYLWAMIRLVMKRPRTPNNNEKE